MVDVIKIHKRGLQTRLMGVTNWKIAPQTRAEVLQFGEELALGKVNKGKKISESRQTKYLDMLKIPLEFFNKPTGQLTERDVENFEKALSGDVIKSRLKKRGYSHASKVDIRKALKIYLRWK